MVGIHEAATTGCVEVVMDEEFIGGSTLQGACSNFRGKLCVWAHLLKVTPENSRTLVNKLVPKQNGQNGYDNIIASVEHDSLGNKGEATVVVTAMPQKNPTSPKRAAQAARSEGMQKNNNGNGNGRANSRAGSRGRAASAGRGKQGAWKEALGPSEKGLGWKGKDKRGPSTGLARWKKLVESKPSQPGKQAPSAKGAGQKSQELKAMLGVSASAPPAPTPPSTAAGLKALLGVGGASANTGIPLSQVPAPPMPPAQMMSQGPPQPPQPLSAADKLLAMMQSKQPQMQQGPMYPGPPQPTSFNFTYVEEGKEGPPQPQMQQQMMPPPNHPMQYPPLQNAYNYGYPMPPPAHMMPPPPMQMHSPPPPQPSAGPSVEEFPPLGATAAPPKAIAPKAEESKSAAPVAPAAIVPTAIKSKSRK